MRNLVRLTLVFGLCALLLALSQGLVFAQGGGGGGGGRGNFDPAQMQERRVDGVIQDLELKDEEATALKPLVTEVVKCQMSQMMGRMGGGRRPGGGGGGGGQGGREQAPEIQALRDAVEKADTPAAELQAKMKAVRDARKKAEEALQKARKALKDAVTARQEARLLLSGILD